MHNHAKELKWIEVNSVSPRVHGKKSKSADGGARCPQYGMRLQPTKLSVRQVCFKLLL
jgi:hypothetical protein